MPNVDPDNHFWLVGEPPSPQELQKVGGDLAEADKREVWSSAAKGTVRRDVEAYQTFLAAGRFPGHARSYAELHERLIGWQGVEGFHPDLAKEMEPAWKKAGHLGKA